MLTFRELTLMMFGSALLAGCAMQPEVQVSLAAPIAAPAREALYTPDQVRAGRLEYAPDRSTFAPVLTERAAYPTQPQAQNAFLRSQWTAVRFSGVVKGPVQSITLTGPSYPAAGVRLFACHPGALDGQTGRMVRYRGPVVLCATEFLDEAVQRLWRAPINFYFHQNAWRMHDPDPPRAPAPWLNPEPSPVRSWNPFGDRI
ncbi:MAG: hypothetical protein IOC94_15735 [Methylocystis sp.]|nr:hypothetical protein [Methylocystis sp.]